MVQLFIDGGGFMWPILFIFIIGFVFVGERLYHLVKGLASDEKFAIERASKYHSKLQDEWLDKDSGSVEEYTKTKQNYFNDAVEQNPNIRSELREALKLPMKYYAGGTVPRSARRY